MPRFELDSTQVVLELEALLAATQRLTDNHAQARKQLRRGLFLARAAYHGLAWHLHKWSDALSVDQEYGLVEPPTPAEVEFARLAALIPALENREQEVRAAEAHERCLMLVRLYQTSAFYHARHTFPSLHHITLRQLPAALLALTDLEILGLGKCGLIDLTGIGQLRALRHLSLRQNHLNTLPSDFAQLQQLAWLDLSYNYLANIAAPLLQLEQLAYLDLRGNVLTPRDKALLRAKFTHIRLHLDP